MDENLDDQLIALAKQLKADRRRARRIGVTLGVAAMAAPFVLFGLLPLGGLGGNTTPWSGILQVLVYAVIWLTPVFIGVGFALLNIGLALRKREDWLKQQAKIESPSAKTEFVARRRRDVKVLLVTTAGIVLFEIAAFLGLAYLQSINAAWDQAQTGPTYYNAPLTGLFIQLYELVGNTAPLLLAAAVVLASAATTIIRRNRAILGATRSKEPHDEPNSEQ